MTFKRFVVIIVVVVAAMLFLIGMAINLFAPLIAAVIMVMLAYFLAIQAFYFICGVILMPAQVPVMIWGHQHFWWGDSGVFALCYNSPTAWFSSILIWAGIVCWLGYAADPSNEVEMREKRIAKWDVRDAVAARQTVNATRREPTLALAVSAPLTGRDAVAAMVRHGNAAALAKLRGEVHSRPAPVYVPGPEYPEYVAGSDPEVDDTLAAIRCILDEDEPPTAPVSEAVAYRARMRRQKQVEAEARANVRRQADDMARLHERIEDLTYQLEQRAYQQRQQTVVVQHVCPEPEPGLLATIHGGLTNMVRGVGHGIAASGGATLGAGLVINRRHPLG